MVLGFPLGRNACTILAALEAHKCLSSELNISLNKDNILRSVSSFANIMKLETSLLSQLNLSAGQVNVDVQETLTTRSDHFLIDRSSPKTLLSTACLLNKWTEICEMQEEMCAIVIVLSPDKSILLCFDSTERRCALLKYHIHGIRGGLIAVGD